MEINTIFKKFRQVFEKSIWKTQGSSSVTNEEAYKLLGLKKGASKEEVLKASNQLQKKIHPDMNRDVNTERLSQLVNEAKEKIIRSDFS